MVPDLQQILFFIYFSLTSLNSLSLLTGKRVDASIANDTKLKADDVGDGDVDAEFVLDDSTRTPLEFSDTIVLKNKLSLVNYGA